MPKIYRVELSGEDRTKLNQLSQQNGLPKRLRLRLEMVRLSDLGFTIPQIAHSLQQHQQTVRKYLKAFLKEGFLALYDRPHPGVTPKLKVEHIRALEQRLDEDAQGVRTWTAPQLLEWLAQTYQVKISRGHLSRVLNRRKFRYKRTKRSVQHKKSNPQIQAAKEADLETLIFKTD
jgi:transposase